MSIFTKKALELAFDCHLKETKQRAVWIDGELTTAQAFKEFQMYEKGFRDCEKLLLIVQGMKGKGLLDMDWEKHVEAMCNGDET